MKLETPIQLLSDFLKFRQLQFHQLAVPFTQSLWSARLVACRRVAVSGGGATVWST
ncbi:MAG TPA: hypothetical protein VK388_02340 [Pyrinomonadaceae bacterium]|nr:hypothetical protein [Pyrinomonadaceae bacterium]